MTDSAPNRANPADQSGEPARAATDRHQTVSWFESPADLEARGRRRPETPPPPDWPDHAQPPAQPAPQPPLPEYDDQATDTAYYDRLYADAPTPYAASVLVGDTAAYPMVTSRPGGLTTVEPALLDPALFEPALPEPALPGAALPDPALPDLALPDLALPGAAPTDQVDPGDELRTWTGPGSRHLRRRTDFVPDPVPTPLPHPGTGTGQMPVPGEVGPAQPAAAVAGATMQLPMLGEVPAGPGVPVTAGPPAPPASLAPPAPPAPPASSIMAGPPVAAPTVEVPLLVPHAFTAGGVVGPAELDPQPGPEAAGGPDPAMATQPPDADLFHAGDQPDRDQPEGDRPDRDQPEGDQPDLDHQRHDAGQQFPAHSLDPGLIWPGQPSGARVLPGAAGNTRRDRPRRYVPPRRPAVGLPLTVLVALLSAFFAWSAAEPFWLAVGHFEPGTATVTRCDGAGLTRRCVARFTDERGTLLAEDVRLAGASDGQRDVGAAVPARMVRADGRAAYPVDSQRVRLNLLVSTALVVLCGFLLALVGGVRRLPPGRPRVAGFLASVAAPVLLLIGMIAVSW